LADRPSFFSDHERLATRGTELARREHYVLVALRTLVQQPRTADDTEVHSLGVRAKAATSGTELVPTAGHTERSAIGKSRSSHRSDFPANEEMLRRDSARHTTDRMRGHTEATPSITWIANVMPIDALPWRKNSAGSEGRPEATESLDSTRAKVRFRIRVVPQLESTQRQRFQYATDPLGSEATYARGV